MPTVFRFRGLRFFYSNEGTEPPHVHVESGTRTAKFWPRPVECARSRGFAAHELRELADIITENRDQIEEAWHEHFRS